MYRGIAEIKTLDYEDQVNNYLSLGWILIGFVPQMPIDDLERKHNKYIKYIMGMPRMNNCSCGEKATTYNFDLDRWRCDNPGHTGNPPFIHTGWD